MACASVSPSPLIDPINLSLGNISANCSQINDAIMETDCERQKANDEIRATLTNYLNAMLPSSSTVND